MKILAVSSMLMLASAFAQAAPGSITVYQDPDCGCCTGWADHMRQAGFTVSAIKTSQMASIKEKLGVPMELASCHTAVIDETGQVIEGHVPAAAVNKMRANRTMKGVAAPGMPMNSPGMGQLDGNLITLDFNGVPFSKD